MMSEEPNPYESPQIVDVTSSSEHDAPIATPLKLCIWWTILFPINMLVPLAVSGIEVRKDQDAIYGMGVACLILYAIGLLLCVRSQLIGRALNSGGLILALSQFIPILQAICAFNAVKITKYLGLVEHISYLADGEDHGFDKLTTIIGGFTVTILTGAPIILLALLIGLWIFRRSIRRTENQS